MRIRIGDSGRIDFTMPIQVTDEQVKKIEKFLKSIYHESVIAVIPLSEDKKFRTNRLGDKPGPMYPRWKTSENTILLDFEKIDESEIAESIGRTETAVYMRRGQWIAQFMEWAGDRNIYENTRELVQEFAEYLEKEKLEKREHRKRERDKDKKRKKQLHTLERTLEIQQNMAERYPNRKERYEKAVQKIQSEIEKVKREFENDND